ncbi:hypothetical protein [Altererythrobacter fulvus]|uniref:hypothetical protein n=1 Tax=Caenibius fulvus TaxID=2126012 RepID=UPI00301657C0
MPEDHAAQLKARMRLDLKEAMKGKRAEEITVLRVLLAAIDNAEAPEIGSAPLQVSGLSNEVERLALSPEKLEAILAAELEDREQAAAQLAPLGQAERAEALLREAAIVRRYCGE